MARCYWPPEKETLRFQAEKRDEQQKSFNSSPILNKRIIINVMTCYYVQEKKKRNQFKAYNRKNSPQTIWEFFLLTVQRRCFQCIVRIIRAHFLYFSFPAICDIFPFDFPCLSSP